MKCTTSRFGEIEVDEGNIIFFPSGVIGFKDNKKYTILPHKKDSPLLWLQSLENEAIAFLIMNPLLFLAQYFKDVASNIDWDMNDENTDNFDIYGIIVVTKEEKKNILMNLLAPVVIDKSKKIGQQIIIQDSDYKVAEPIAPYIQKVTAVFNSLKK